MTQPTDAEIVSSVTVLLIDDQPSIVHAFELGLRRRSSGVLTAGNGREALAILGSQQGVDVLVSDIMRPGGMSGFELVRLAHELRPCHPSAR